MTRVMQGERAVHLSLERTIVRGLTVFKFNPMLRSMSTRFLVPSTITCSAAVMYVGVTQRRV